MHGYDLSLPNIRVKMLLNNLWDKSTMVETLQGINKLLIEH